MVVQDDHSHECEKVTSETHAKGKTLIRSSCRWHGGVFDSDEEWSDHVMANKLAWLSTKYAVRT